MWNSNIQCIYNRTGYGQSKVLTPVLQNLKLAQLVTFKKSVYPVCPILRSTFNVKAKRIIAYVDFYVVPKCRVWLKLKCSSLFNTLFRKTLTYFKDANLRYWTKNVKTPKILHIVFCNLSQIDVTKMLCPFHAMNNF